MRNSLHRRHAFSLVELSIVLVILGLLVGGILAGQSLIRAAELRTASAEWSRYQSAMYAFRDKYFAFPGDMTNATAFWGLAHASGGTTVACYLTASSDSKTCDGNGDGDWDENDGGSNSYNEAYRLWQHLANAGMIEGQYTGTRDASASKATIGKNVPASKVSGAGWAAVSFTQSVLHATYFMGSYVGFLLGAEYFPYTLLNPELMPEAAWNIDTKLDDGRPGLGMVRSNVPCATSATKSIADYNLVSGTKNCFMLFSLVNPG